MSTPQFAPRATSPTITAQRAATILGVTRRTLYRWEVKGQMPPRYRQRGRNQWHLVDISNLAITNSQRTPKAGSI